MLDFQKPIFAGRGLAASGWGHPAGRKFGGLSVWIWWAAPEGAQSKPHAARRRTTLLLGLSAVVRTPVWPE